jgi:hypothetical protein
VLLSVADMLMGARWPVPIFMPLLLPLLPLQSADAATLGSILHKLLRIQDLELLAYAEKPSADRQDDRRMFQVCQWNITLAASPPPCLLHFFTKVAACVVVYRCGRPLCRVCCLSAVFI